LEPLHPTLRRELKRAHPGLADRDIDRLEELVATRFTLDPERDAEAIRRLDVEKAELIAQAMPRFDEVYQRFRAARREKNAPRRGARFRVERRDLE
jgi:hypothetical protein